MSRCAIEIEAESLERQAAELGEIFARSVVAAGLAMVAVFLITPQCFPERPFGYLYSAVAGLAAGHSIRSTWREWRRARRRASAMRGVGCHMSTHWNLHRINRPARMPKGDDPHGGGSPPPDPRRAGGGLAAAPR